MDLSDLAPIPVSTLLAISATVCSFIGYKWSTPLITRFDIRTRQLSEEKAKAVGVSIAGALNGSVISYLRESKAFDLLLRDRIRDTHEVKNLQAAQKQLVSMFQEQRERMDEHVEEDRKAHERIGELGARVSDLRDEFERTTDRLEKRIEKESEATREKVSELVETVSSQSGEFRSTAGEFRRLRELLEARLK